MRSRFARLLLIVTALWLPLQAMAGMTMKIGVPAPVAVAAATVQVQDDVEEACPYHRHGSSPDVPVKPQPAQPCDNCGVCHLAATGYMPVAADIPPIAPARHSYTPAPLADRPSHIPEPPQYPPKHA